MSLLEDVFLQDEADEAQQLERVIEGDECDERPRSRSVTPDSDENINRDDEAEEDKRRVDPSSTKAKRVTKNPRFVLNPARLTGPRGIQILPDHFKDFKFKGKGHEKEDVDMVLKKLEHWAYRLYPKFQFEDCLKKIETLGKKRPVMVQLQKIRTDQFISEEDTVVQKDSSDEETQPPQEEDEFDKLLQQQIEIARATPAPGSVKKVMDTPKQDRSPFTMPKATSSPSINDEQKERMIRNRRLAEERRLARLKQSSMNISEKQDSTNNISEIIEVDEENVESNVTAKKHNRSHVIDSSDDEGDVSSVNQAVTVDVHNSKNIDEEVDDLSTKKTYVDDVEMEQNVDKNDAIEIDQDFVEVIDDVGKDICKGDKINGQTDKVVDEIIEINDHDDKNYPIRVDQAVIEITDDKDKKIEAIDQPCKVVDEIIEINDQINKDNDIIEIDKDIGKDVKKIGQTYKIVDDVIEINYHYDKVTDKIDKESRIFNDSEVIEENNGTVTIDITNDDRKQTPTKSYENQSKFTKDDFSQKVQTENVILNITGEITGNEDDVNVRRDSASNDNNKCVTLIQNDDEMADIMDVDFSDDF